MDAVRRTASLTGLAGEEYNEAVREGRVVNAQEYEETLLFLSRAREGLLALGLPEDGETALVATFDSIGALVRDTADPDLVRALAAESVDRLARSAGVSLVEFPEEPLSLGRGARIYRRYCAHCHGAAGDGRGPLAGTIDPPPVDFLDGSFMAAETPYDFYQVIGAGIPGTAMEGWGHVLSSRERWEVTAYLFTLRSTPEEVAEGERLYRRYCSECHVDGDGGPAPLDDLRTYGRMSDGELASLVREGLGEEAGDAEASAGSGAPEGTAPEEGHAFAGRLSGDEVRRIVAYIRSRVAGPDPAAPRGDVVAGIARDVLTPLRLVGEEYGEAVAGDSVVNPPEYAEARLFLETAREAYRAGREEVESRDPALALEVEETLAALEADLAGRAAPTEVAAKVGAVVPGLRALAGSTGTDAARVRAALETVRTELDRGLELYRSGDREAAGRAAFDAYMAFEPLEPALRPRAPELASSLEGGFADLRGYLAEPGREERVGSLHASITGELERVGDVLLERTGGWGTFLQSFFIILREGFEAILIVGALAAFLAKTGAPERRSAVYWGAGWAVLASVVTAALVEWVFDVAPASQEVLEGATMLLAVVFLFIVSYWLISKIEHRRFQAYIRSKMAGALEDSGRSTGLALGSLAFLAVYREGFETILFYKALLGFSGGTESVAGGFVAGSVVLAGIFVAFYRFGLRIPMRPFFAGTSLVLYYLALVFAGQGIRELQEGGIVSATPLEGVPTVDWLGMYPTMETVAAQGLLLGLFAFALVWTFMIRPIREAAVEA